MKKGLIRLLFLLLLSSNLLGSVPANPLLDQLIQQGKEQLYRFNLDSSLATFKQVQKTFPAYPHGYFYEAYLLLIYYSQDEANLALEGRFKAAAQKAAEVGEQFRKRDPANPEGWYYEGITQGVWGIYHVLNHSYIKAYFAGRKAKGYLEKTVELDSTYYDAYLGLGIFHYYVDLLPGLLKFIVKILGFEGNRELGRQEIWWTASKGQFFRKEAQFGYYVMEYFLEGKYAEGIRGVMELYREYPHNPALSLLLGYHYRRTRQLAQAISMFESVSDRYKENLPSISIMKYYNLMVCYFTLNRFDRAEAYLNRLLNGSLRISPYYTAAISYYQGLLADLKFQREKALQAYRKIKLTKKTKYWYYNSRMLVKYPMDSLMYRYIRAMNMVGSQEYASARKIVRELDIALNRREVHASNPELPFLVADLYAVVEFNLGNRQFALRRYRRLEKQLYQMEDEFARSWILIHYAQVLRLTGKLKHAERMLEKASEVDDDYTRFIIEREKFLVHNGTKKS